GFSLNLSTGIGYSKSQDDKRGNGDTVRQIGSVLSGGSIAATSGRDTLVKASTVVADGKVSINATGDLSIVSAADRDTGDYATSSKKSGTIGSNFQPAIGTVKTTTDGRHANSTQVGSQVASLGGDVELTAGGRYTQTASQVKAPGGDIAITAKDVLVNAGYSTTDSTDHTTYAKTAIGGTVSVPLINAVNGIVSMASAAKTTKDPRMQALAAASMVSGAFDAAKSAADLVGGSTKGIKVSVSLGNSKSETNSVQSASVAVGSTIAAGGSVTIKATGGGKDSNITAIGSDISAGTDVMLNAGNQVNLLAAESTVSQHSTNSSSGASIGIGFAFGGQQSGMTFDFAASKARGNADGDDLSHSNTHVTGGALVTVTSGGDTNVKGGVIAGDSVLADVGGNLNIESLQDSSTYKSKQVSGGFGVSLCIPPVCYGISSVSANLSKSKVEGDFLSVIEQSGIKAGDGGFDLTVKGNTDLKGAVLSSNQTAIDDELNSLVTGSLTTSDLQNKDHHEASGFSVSGSVSGKYGDQSDAKGASNQAAASDDNRAGPGGGAGFGSASGSQQSVTLTGISDGFIDITDGARQRELTGNTVDQQLAGLNRDVSTEKDGSAGLIKGWDGKALELDVNTQTAIVSAFSQMAAKRIGDYAAKQEKALTKSGDLLEAKKWADDGEYRIAAHIAAGALGGGLSGALGAGLSAELMPQIGKLIKGTDLPEPVQQVLGAAAAAAIGGIVGDASGAMVALNVDVNNRQLHPKEIDWVLKNVKDFSAQLSDKLGRPVSELEAARWLTKGAEGNVDKVYQDLNGSTLGSAASEERQAYMFAKQYIAVNAKGGFIDENGVSQKLFVAKGGDLYNSSVYSDYRDSKKYRDYFWQVVGDNIKPSNPTSDELAVYNEREKTRLTNSVKDLLVGLTPGLLVGSLVGVRNSVSPIWRDSSSIGESVPSTPRRVFAGVELDSYLPDPAAGLGYVPKMVKGGTEANLWSHWVGFQAELNLANIIAKTANQVVIKYGDAIGRKGADIISVDVSSGDVTMWDSKFRSSSKNIGNSPTFENARTLNSAVLEAIDSISSSRLPPAVRDAAIRNLENRSCSTHTVGSGSVKNSISNKYCNGKKC
ncbi:hemagglutinin repeat-containing protein, partial [Rugamonas rubra]